MPTLGDGRWPERVQLRPERAQRSQQGVGLVRGKLAGSFHDDVGLSRQVATQPAPQLGVADGPGTALYDADGRLLSLDESAERLFAELASPASANLPVEITPLLAVVARAAAVVEGRDRGPASARLRAASGRWLSVHASCLRTPSGQPSPTALTIEPAKSAQIAPIIVEGVLPDDPGAGDHPLGRPRAVQP